MSITVVISTYNRSDLVPLSIHSALNELKSLTEFEVVVVDDASTDDTIQNLNKMFPEEIASGKVKLIKNAVNRGVTGSKNLGYSVSRDNWVIFLDSDDVFLKDVGERLISTLNKYSHFPILFFRCLGQDGNVVGTPFETDLILDLNTYLQHTSYGEALIAINKKMAPHNPFIESLRGYEGLGCCRVIAQHGPGILVAFAARQYNQHNENRLSVSIGLYSRLHLIARGHLMLIREFGNRMRFYKKVGYLFKFVIYSLVGKAYCIIKGIRN